MFLAIYKDINNKITRYYYLKDNEIYYDEYSNNGCKVYKTTSLYDFYKLFSYFGNSKLLEVDNQYNIYLDDNGYKHYIKNGKEDFLQFFLNNGTDFILYSDKDETKNEKTKRFLVGGVLATIYLVCSVQVFDMLQDVYHSYRTTPSLAEIKEMEAVNCSNIINMIKELDTLSDEHKNDILNSGILENVISYYGNFELETLIKHKLKDLSIQYYDDTYLDNDLGYVRGYYNILKPNIIYLRNGTNDSAFDHEFVHLLQSPDFVFEYIDEPVAELMKHEFFGGKIEAYIDEISVLKLLICTIGPEPILKCSFAGDSSSLLDILEKNLETSDYEKIVSYLKELVSTNGFSNNREMQEIIERLYKNMYGTEMRDTLPGYDFIVNHEDYHNIVDNRYYLNTDKIGIEGEITFDVNNDLYESTIKNINVLKVDDINYYKKQITEDEYNQFSNSESDYKTKIEYSEEVKEVKNVISTNNNYISVIISKDGQLYSIDMQSAIKKGYVKFVIVAREDQIDLNDSEWVFDHQDKRITTMLPPITSTFRNNLHESSEETLNMKINQMIDNMVDGIIDINGKYLNNYNDANNKNSNGYNSK